MTHFVYADHAATTAVSQAALDAMLPLLQHGYGNPSSLYRFGQEAKEVLEQARGQIARALNAESNEIFFTSGGTESDNWALIGTAMANRRAGKHIITTAIEHAAVLQPMLYLQEQGLR